MRSEKFRPHLFFLLYHHFQLQLECLGGLFLDLFDTLNPPVESICPCDYRLLRYRQNRVQFLRREKFRQHLFFLLYHHFQLQLERLGGLFLDLFDALNPPVASICPWDRRLLRYKQNRRPTSDSEKFRQLFHPPLPPLSTTIRAPWRIVSGPI